MRIRLDAVFRESIRLLFNRFLFMRPRGSFYEEDTLHRLAEEGKIFSFQATRR